MFGAGLAGAGLALLAATVPAPATIAAALTFLAYAFIYTPLKTVTAWNTAVGAVPGALPPVIGWYAARGWDGWAGWEGAAVVFGLLFLWQIPHFLAIAWMYRVDYADGGLKMLPGCDPSGKRTAFVMVATAAALVPLGFLAHRRGWAAGCSQSARRCSACTSCAAPSSSPATAPTARPGASCTRRSSTCRPCSPS